MTTWAKEVNHALVYASGEEFKGVPNWATHEKRCRKAGYLPLEGEPEPREGYSAEPASWHTVEQSETRVEPRQVVVEDWETDPETGERRKVGEHTEMRDTEVTFDTSYIQVDSWNYVPIPVPEPILPRRFSKGDLLEALQGCNLYDQAKAIYAADMDLQIAWAGFADIDMDYPAAQGIMAQYPELFSAENVLALQRYIAEHTNI
jgi:hypothetical protein